MQLVGVKAGHEKEADRWLRGWEQESQAVWMRATEVQGEDLRRDWRPMCDFTRNLDRMADLLLDTDAAWVVIGKAYQRPRAALGAVFGPHGGARAEPANDRMLADQMVLQYPWWWSAGVLAGLLGISAWTLTRRVKSLDRLR